MQVYDEFVIRENMAIMRCHVPSIIREYIRVVAWLRDEQVLVTASHNPRKCLPPEKKLNLIIILVQISLHTLLCQLYTDNLANFLLISFSRLFRQAAPLAIATFTHNSITPIYPDCSFAELSVLSVLFYFRQMPIIF